MKSSSKYNILFAAFACMNSNLGYFFFDYNLSVFNAILPFLSDYVFPEASTGVITFIASAPIITAAVSAMFGGSLVAKFGRRKMMIISDIVAIIGVILTLVASLPVVIIGRLLIGFHLGNTTVAVPLYFTEIPPVEYVGPLGIGPSLIGSFGIFLAFCLGLIVPTTLAAGETSETWRILQAISILFAAWRIINFLIFFRYETPQHLIAHNKIEEAEKALGEVYKVGVKERVDELIKDRDYVKMKGKVGFLELFTKKYARALIVGIVMMSLQHISGLNIVMVFSKTIFGAGIEDPDDKLPSYLSIALGGCYHIISYSLAWFVGRFNRKTLLVFGTFSLGLLEIIFGVISKASDPSSIASKIFMVLWPIPFAFSLGTIPNIMVPETLPEEGVSIALLTNWIWGFLTVQFFPNITNAIGIDVTFIIMGGICILASLYFWIEAVETKGKSKTEILQEYNGLKNTGKAQVSPAENSELTSLPKMVKEDSTPILTPDVSISGKEIAA